MKRFFRKLHRWLGLLMVLQITAWMASGLYFALIPIETIRGEHLVTEADAALTAHVEGIAAPFVAWQAVREELGNEAQLTGLSLSLLEDEVYYRVTGSDPDGQPFTRLVDPDKAAVVPFLGKDLVIGIVNKRLREPASLTAAELITEAPAGSEYRGRSLPLWRVSYAEPESLNVYVDGWTGDIVARRTTRWRIFDFLWMLHIMDFEERDDFNSRLLQVSAALGLILALSGLVYWAYSTRLFRKRRHLPAPQ